MRSLHLGAACLLASCASFGSAGSDPASGIDAGPAPGIDAGSDAGSDAAADAPDSPPDAGADAPSEAGFSTIACATGGAECKVGTEVCCVLYTPTPTADKCIAVVAGAGLDAPCPGGTGPNGSPTRIVGCDDSSECPAPQICCGRIDASSQLSSACVAPGNCNLAGLTPMCKQVGSTCLNGTMCVRNMDPPLYPLYAFCK